jgi:hypothetical protein
MNLISGGGAATNAGIDYQQRIAAFFLIYMLLGRDISEILDIYNSKKIINLSFETSDKIDDIKVCLEGNAKIFIQAKRRLNLSSSKNSQFYSVLKQFVEQYSLRSVNSEYFMLITSSQASSKIIRDLRKIIESIQINDTGFQFNPLNQSEIATLKTYKSLVRKCFLSIEHRKITDDDFFEFSRKIKIIIFDIESGMSFEKSILILLTGFSKISPSLLWKSLISYALELSSKRLSINKEGLASRFGKFFCDVDDCIGAQEDLSNDEKLDLLNLEIQSINSISSGREVLLIEAGEELLNISEKPDYILVEMIRFRDDFSKKHLFIDNKCFITADFSWNVIYRASTYQGINRIIEKSLIDLSGKKITIAPLQLAEEDEDPDLTLCSQLYSESCNAILKQNSYIHKCLHCDKSILGTEFLLVELDDKNSEHMIGCIHIKCLRSIDRIIGIIESNFLNNYSHLKKFDFQLWSELIKNGQYCFDGIKSTNIDSNNFKLITWSSDCEYNSTYSYCVKTNLENDDYVYVTDRGKIHRMNLLDAQETVQVSNNLYKEWQEIDPLCYTSKTMIFGPYSKLITVKNNDEKCLKCICSEVVKYNKVIEKIYDLHKSFYAPLFIILDEIDELPIEINYCIVVMTNPLEFDSFLDNWQQAGLHLSNYELKIIEHDWDFDKFAEKIFHSDKPIIVDPILDRDGVVVKCSYIMDENMSKRYQIRMRQSVP